MVLSPEKTPACSIPKSKSYYPESRVDYCLSGKDVRLRPDVVYLRTSSPASLSCDRRKGRVQITRQRLKHRPVSLSRTLTSCPWCRAFPVTTLRPPSERSRTAPVDLPALSAGTSHMVMGRVFETRGARLARGNLPCIRAGIGFSFSADSATISRPQPRVNRNFAKNVLV